MKSNKLAYFLLLLVGICLTSNVYAKDYPSTTGYVDNPSLQLGVTTKTKTYELKTSYTTIQGKNSRVFFWNRGSIPSYYVASNDRTLEILLKEADAGDNADDVVKKYTYHFVGRKMDGVDVKTEDDGNIDSKGDNVGEFYLEMTLIPVTGDTAWNQFTGTFFQYEISIK